MHAVAAKVTYAGRCIWQS